MSQFTQPTVPYSAQNLHAMHLGCMNPDPEAAKACVESQLNQGALMQISNATPCSFLRYAVRKGIIRNTLPGNFQAVQDICWKAAGTMNDNTSQQAGYLACMRDATTARCLDQSNMSVSLPAAQPPTVQPPQQLCSRDQGFDVCFKDCKNLHNATRKCLSCCGESTESHFFLRKDAPAIQRK